MDGRAELIGSAIVYLAIAALVGLWLIVLIFGPWADDCHGRTDPEPGVPAVRGRAVRLLTAPGM